MVSQLEMRLDTRSYKMDRNLSSLKLKCQTAAAINVWLQTRRENMKRNLMLQCMVG